ncbi:hypothetical protein J3R30DRAFT_3409777 [Lentinula aciculospora]|uniref:Uncharacterized protein n=1 Tax=Lentinula aciculospora TaxID=153920 RepID=A0A9W8ZXB6_9AGAR|nr:hypothetical protein J3R30DRAFT_3409777 [Lentinula aciculospora]
MAILLSIPDGGWIHWDIHHWIITFIRLFEAFITAKDPLGPAHFVNDLAQPTGWTAWYGALSTCLSSWRLNKYWIGLICWTLIRHDRMNYSHGLSTNILKVLAIFVESATIYTAWTIFFFISYLLKADIQFFAIDVFPSIAGISFMLINVRVGQDIRDKWRCLYRI